MLKSESLVPLPAFGKFPKWAEKALESKKFTRYELERLASISLPTNIVMWGYTLLSLFLFTDKEISYWCLALSLCHLLTPFFARHFSGMVGISIAFLGTCLAQQVLLSYSTGGIPSTALVWYGVIPILGGVLAGRKGLMLWCGLVFSVVFYYLFSTRHFPNLLPDNYKTLAAIFDFSGWIFTVVTVINVIIFQRERSEKLLTQKSERINNLLRILTHDVTNSLSMIEMASSLYKRGTETGRPVDKYLERMELASGHINEVIGCVRTLHSAENDWQSLDLRSINLKDCVHRCVRLIEDAANAKNITFKIDNAGLSEEAIIADPLFLNNQVLMNALTNAVKFSHPGSVIEVKSKRSKKLFGLTIKDEGKGMSRDFLRGLFSEKMVRSTLGTQGEKGSGFGVLILKSFMDRFGGKVYIKSEEGEGTEIDLLFKYVPRKVAKRNDFSLGDLVMEGIEAEGPY